MNAEHCVDEKSWVLWRGAFLKAYERRHTQISVVLHDTAPQAKQPISVGSKTLL